ncbi:MAG TPA: Rid family hydrolase [Steroidobacteraceae bacterium]|jgi:2-iminobutanoate/2-iminopropanoate deaminase
MRRIVFTLAALACATGALAADARSYVTPDGFNPATSSPYSLGVMAGGAFYVAGHLGIDPSTGQVASDVEHEAHYVLDQVKSTLQKAGLSMDDLVSVTIYCTDLSLYEKFNGIYRGYFHEHYPARAFIGVDKLVRGAHFEIQAVAVKK